MKLYTFYRSSAAYRVRIALNVKELPYESIAKHLRKDGGQQTKADYRALNPQGLVPTLDDEGVLLSQSLAIIEYLDETHPLPPLLPNDPVARARVRMLAQTIACDIHPIDNLRVLNYLKDNFKVGQQGVDDWYRHWIGEGFMALESWLTQWSKAQEYCFGDSLTLADLCLVPQVYNARRFKFDLTPYPAIEKVARHLETLPAFAAAAPEAQPDAE